MRSPRRAIALLAASLVAAAIAGCGGDTGEKNSYVDDVTSAQRTYVTRFDQVRQRLTATSTLKQDRQTLGDFVGATDRFVAALKAITPPGEVKSEHAKLIATMVGYRTEVEKAVKRIQSGDPADRASIRTDLSSSVQATQQKLQDAIGAINEGLRD